MYMDIHSMAMNALELALDFRDQHNILKKDSFCIFDYAEKAGCKVRFEDISSMEGLYVRSNKEKVIIVSAHRPMGRQRFTCAHELAHHLYRHSVHIDEIVNENQAKSRKNPNEIIADLFASFLLMPSSTVVNGFVRRGWKLNKATPGQIYKVACWLGVGYTTLVNHLLYGVKKISSRHAAMLLQESPKKIKLSILGINCHENVIPIDFSWSGRPVDVFVGDFLISEEKIFYDSNKMEIVSQSNGRNIYKPTKPGLFPITNEEQSWSSFVRVSRSGYFGWGKYRHLDDE